MDQDLAHMRRALRLALKGRGKVSPNPLVGAVVVRQGRVVGEGAHLQDGGPHAEVHAFAAAGAQSQGATLYVTLEPCAHQGRTPPCTAAILAAGIRRVVCALEDPDPRVRGKGIAQLRAAGLQVEVGLGREEAERQNAAYLKHRRTGLPLVILKLAQSLDGRIATAAGDTRWISGEKARTLVHRWRNWTDGVMVGAGTVLADDPLLDVRLVRGRPPRPLVVDGRLRAPLQARVFQRPGAVLVTAQSAPLATRRAFAAQGVEVWTFPSRAGRLDLRQVLERAGNEGLTSILLEGGGLLAAAALRARIVDQVRIFVAPCLIGEGVPAIGELGIRRLAQALRLEKVALRRLGPDLLYTAEVKYPCSPD
ncbi:MAG: bifunctional diaminohydroxyphosphoribosylaminopyrimidine deaminase/5-amino-6-(5-phosphoribosylamino)uracil reductase RibD [Candidatus Latescibacteria bacterium]|nr:bifunctional diaminohydroxyphosphoribosylaminopyrimidine deaminase/5-amino-6-(5-phosphoribosylamino)uracil reductase RibD [Candidatus Latescibacterota bacterium]